MEPFGNGLHGPQAATVQLSQQQASNPSSGRTHLRSVEAQARCHMASENTVAVNSDAGMTKMEE